MADVDRWSLSRGRFYYRKFKIGSRNDDRCGRVVTRSVAGGDAMGNLHPKAKFVKALDRSLLAELHLQKFKMEFWRQNVKLHSKAKFLATP